MITTEIGELLEAPQWDDQEWNKDLHVAVVDAIFQQCMYRPWLDKIATVHDLHDGGIGADGQPDVERFLIPNVKGRMVTWLEPGGTFVDQSVMVQGVFEPPSQIVSFAGGLPLANLRQAETGPLTRMFSDLVDAAAQTLDHGFRRRVGQLRQAGELHVGLWEGIRSRNTTDAGSWTITGSALVAAAAIGDVAEGPTTNPSYVDVTPENDDDKAAKEMVAEPTAGLSAGASEDAPSEGTPPASTDVPTAEQEAAELRAHLEERSAAAAAADEPVGDLVDITEEEELRERASSIGGARVAGR